MSYSMSKMSQSFSIYSPYVISGWSHIVRCWLMYLFIMVNYIWSDWRLLKSDNTAENIGFYRLTSKTISLRSSHTTREMVNTHPPHTQKNAMQSFAPTKMFLTRHIIAPKNISCPACHLSLGVCPTKILLATHFICPR